MPTTRRVFLASSALAAAQLALPGHARALPAGVKQPAPGSAGASNADATLVSTSPLPALAQLATAAIDRARSKGASYADARLVSWTAENVGVRDSRVDRLTRSESLGIAVRVLVDGAWGFAASPQLDAANVTKLTDRALATAKANAALRKRLGTPAVELVATPAATGTWVTPHTIDPFSVPAADKAALLLEATAAALATKGVGHADASVACVREDKLLVTTDGTRVHQVHLRIAPELSATAVDRRRGRFATRDHEAAPMQAGWEYVTELGLANAAPKVATEVLQKLHAPTVQPGLQHVVLAPSNLWLTIHESIGHPTELDRAMGLEANFAGTSFLHRDDAGKLEYGSAKVSVVADRTQPGGLASVGWDDEGVPASRWDLVRAGRFVDWQTTREQAGWIGQTASHGCSYGHGYDGVQFQRMPNVSLQPGADDLVTEDLINSTEDGVYITGRGSWSIDQQRHNFQFGGQMFYRIHKGRIAEVLRDVAYQANTLEFWRSCDLVGGARSYRLGGSMGDGKGEPQQSNAVSHGCPPARFRANVIRTGGDR
ncbi:MAG: TldD/PmbA family protein [Deltaproteobacteria bacterium]|nr:TldD/PmbA family protein [Deltaproteobacteria bacterium]